MLVKRTFLSWALILGILGIFGLAHPAAKAAPMQNQSQLLNQLKEWEKTTHSEFKKSLGFGQNQKQEQLDLIFRLRFMISSRNIQSEKQLPGLIQEMAEIESLPENKATSNLYLHLEKLAWIFKDDYEPIESPMGLIEQFLFSGGLNLEVSAEDFVESRSYKSHRLSSRAADLDPKWSDQGFGVYNFAETFNPELSTEARVLDPSERDTGIGTDEIVPGEDPALDLPTDLLEEIFII